MTVRALLTSLLSPTNKIDNNFVVEFPKADSDSALARVKSLKSFSGSVTMKREGEKRGERRTER